MSAPTTDVSPNAPPSTAATVGGRRRGLSTSWMAHVKATMRSHKGLKLKQVLKLAKKTYKKSKRGGGVALTPATVGGRKRRGTRRSRARRGGNEEMETEETM